MSTLDDFRENLTPDPAHWLVLADWLEERGDERGTWVRYVAANSFADDLEMFPLSFLGTYLSNEGWPFHEALFEPHEHDNWFDVIILLARAHQNWANNRRKLLHELDAELFRIASMKLQGRTDRQIANRLALTPSIVADRLALILDRWRHELTMNCDQG